MADRRRIILVIGLMLLVGMTALVWWYRNRITTWWAPRSDIVVQVPVQTNRQVLQQPDLGKRLADAAVAQVGVTRSYDPAYVKLAYPGGDVPMDRGVCADVVVRAFRTIGIDLQATVHQDMTAHFDAYPTRWGLRSPDSNIDHRRVLNLMTWFDRQGWSAPITTSAAEYHAGDIVAWDLGHGLTHIGVVVPDGQGRSRIVHNIGQGAQQEDVLFSWPQIGHYRLGRNTLDRRERE